MAVIDRDDNSPTVDMPLFDLEVELGWDAWEEETADHQYTAAELRAARTANDKHPAFQWPWTRGSWQMRPPRAR